MPGSRMGTGFYLSGITSHPAGLQHGHVEVSLGVLSCSPPGSSQGMLTVADSTRELHKVPGTVFNEKLCMHFKNVSTKWVSFNSTFLQTFWSALFCRIPKEIFANYSKRKTKQQQKNQHCGCCGSMVGKTATCFASIPHGHLFMSRLFFFQTSSPLMVLVL